MISHLEGWYNTPMLLSNPLLFLLQMASLVVAITIHEFSHAWMADRLGDPTPRLQGRLSLNPLRHLDPLGTLLLVLVRFGWGKPVVFDPYNLKHPRRDSALIALAGPASNVILAMLLALTIRFLGPELPPLFVAEVLSFMLTMNLVLAVFNLIPVHPLDGGKILVGFLPRETAQELDAFLQRYGFIILLLLIFPFGTGRSPISYLLEPIISTVLRFLCTYSAC